MPETYDLIVIGGGSAGLVAAGGAGILGVRVALIEKNRLGGDCLYTGCVPSKTLIKSARFARQLRNADKFGFESNVPTFLAGSFSSITNRIKRVVETIEQHDSPERFREMGVEVIFGAPRFISPFEIQISMNDSNETKTLRSKRFCIATGSRPLIPEIEGLKECGFVTNEEVFALGNLPSRLLVIGGGAIGVELGQAFARLGSSVSIVDVAGRILVKEDEEISESMEKILREEGLRILTGTKITSVRKTLGNVKTVALKNDSGEFEIEADEILVAIGRRANVEGLVLDRAGVAFNANSIPTNAFLQTSAKHIYAAGDVTGHFQFTHMADYEAQIALQNCIAPFPFKKKVDFRAAPWATFTDPEIARVGLTEIEAREKFGTDLKVFRSEFSQNDRATTEDETMGFVKILAVRNRIVGAHIFGAHAGELIHEFVWAVREQWNISDLNKIIRVYPTLSKIIQDIGTQSTIAKLQSPLTKKFIKAYLKYLR